VERIGIPYPNTWYHALYTDELESGQLSSLEYLGRDLVAFRDSAGTPHILDAHCPHLGAHLGKGGQVEGDIVRCPFHAWEWNGEGECARIPYSSRIPAAAKIRSYPTVERNGQIYFWYHADDEAPSFEPPTIEEWSAPGWTQEWRRAEWTIRGHPQEILENGVDWQHFPPVHLMDPPTTFDFSVDGPYSEWCVGASRSLEAAQGEDGLFSSATMNDEFSIHSKNFGLGLMVMHFNGARRTLFQVGYTPIADDRLQYRQMIIGMPEVESGEASDPVLDAFINDLVKSAEQDFHIFENKVHRTRPLLLPEDGPISEFRRWAAQFYSKSSGQNSGESDLGQGPARVGARGAS